MMQVGKLRFIWVFSVCVIPPHDLLFCFQFHDPLFERINSLPSKQLDQAFLFIISSACGTWRCRERTSYKYIICKIRLIPELSLMTEPQIENKDISFKDLCLLKAYNVYSWRVGIRWKFGRDFCSGSASTHSRLRDSILP